MSYTEEMLPTHGDLKTQPRGRMVCKDSVTLEGVSCDFQIQEAPVNLAAHLFRAK